MDPLHMKIGVDLTANAPTSEDEFYKAHSCSWLHFTRATARKVLAILRSYEVQKHQRHKIDRPT